jgi:putative NADPH-quinone reductase
VSRILVVRCHPLTECYIEAVYQRVLSGLAGADVETIDLYTEGFRPELSTDDEDGDVQRHRDLLRWCDTLLLVYPTWWAAQPAMLKGWIDRVWGTAFKGGDRFTNIGRIVAITSHGSSKLINMLEGEGGKRTITRNLAPACSRRTRTKWVALYGIDRLSAARRSRFLDRAEKVARSLV